MVIQPASLVVTIFGGVRRTARLLGISPATVRKWSHSGGHIPAKNQRRLLDLAQQNGLRLTAEDIVLGRNVAEPAMA
jgi:hypothetical protein